ncbi:MOB kinase activator-like 1A isoform X1 [Cucumis melo var. makuwa]|uniref:MOB kinase activator-like 1A isoform X1 n=1 Tax=Cucumis melo var. makuwa TaxID=1194695 RepID=A0A5D3DBU8_CUCMM|nr:MOB kinase activator-like 1A isoform X1 [Cucumis melo var. makuwa]TYK21052.1 MOB kinase activator-like 1A isoform X1 [Cucumis melo var. makuwa]
MGLFHPAYPAILQIDKTSGQRVRAFDSKGYFYRIGVSGNYLLSKGAQLRKHIDATLGSGNLREAVRLPTGEDLNEWLAVNTVDFFNQVNLLYGTLTEFCTPENCPTMTAGPKYEYRWADGVQIKKPIEVSAPKYVEYLMDWIESQLDDESIFPQKLGTPFPPNFKDVVKTIFKRLWKLLPTLPMNQADLKKTSFLIQKE